MFEKGTVVLVPFPFTDLSGTKVRPALILSHKLGGEDVVVAFITARLAARIEKFDIRIVPSKENGLKTESIVKCAKLATLDKKIILGKLGKISAADALKVNKKLKTVFGLS